MFRRQHHHLSLLQLIHNAAALEGRVVLNSRQSKDPIEEVQHLILKECGLEVQRFIGCIDLGGGFAPAGELRDVQRLRIIVEVVSQFFQIGSSGLIWNIQSVSLC